MTDDYPSRALERLQKAGPTWRHIGIDEAGRGPLAGPVVAAAVVLDTEHPWDLFKDSKKLTALQRQAAFKDIVAHHSFGIGVVHPHDVDRLNILHATFLAMERAVENLQEKYGLVPCRILIDGNSMPAWAQREPWQSQCLVNGDSLDSSISAASIVAKHTRDAWMQEMAKIWPAYGFERHMGYGVPEHLSALARSGACPIHRRSYAPLKDVRAVPDHKLT